MHQGSTMSNNRIYVIGSGLSGLIAAAYVGKYGFDMDVFERSSYPDGYARRFGSQSGNCLELHPSMPALSTERSYHPTLPKRSSRTADSSLHQWVDDRHTDQ